MPDKQRPSPRAFRILAIAAALLLLANIGVVLWYLLRPPSIESIAVEPRQFARIHLFRSLPVDSGAIVFIGDSHTEQFHLAEWLDDQRVVNRGIGGITVPDVAAFAPDVCGPAPAAIFVQCGINDLMQGTSATACASHLNTLLADLHKRFPAARIVLQSLLPTADKGMDTEVRAVNTRLADIAREQAITYVDLYTDFAVEDHIDPALTYDGLHLTGAGYARWAARIKPLLPPAHF